MTSLTEHVLAADRRQCGADHQAESGAAADSEEEEEFDHWRTSGRRQATRRIYSKHMAMQLYRPASCWLLTTRAADCAGAQPPQSQPFKPYWSR